MKKIILTFRFVISSRAPLTTSQFWASTGKWFNSSSCFSVSSFTSLMFTFCHLMDSHSSWTLRISLIVFHVWFKYKRFVLHLSNWPKSTTFESKSSCSCFKSSASLFNFSNSLWNSSSRENALLVSQFRSNRHEVIISLSKLLILFENFFRSFILEI